MLRPRRSPCAEFVATQPGAGGNPVAYLAGPAVGTRRKPPAPVHRSRPEASRLPAVEPGVEATTALRSPAL